jgi:hypothetical protein
MSKILCFFFGHIKGTTDMGLPIFPVGGYVSRIYKIPPFMPIYLDDDTHYPKDLFDSYSQEIFTCSRCNQKLVHHK